MNKPDLKRTLWSEIKRLNLDYIGVINRLMNTMTNNELKRVIKELQNK